MNQTRQTKIRRNARREIFVLSSPTSALRFDICHVTNSTSKRPPRFIDNIVSRYVNVELLPLFVCDVTL